MSRDMERLCEREGLALRRPSVFPRHSVLAAPIELVANAEGGCPQFTTAVFAANFADDRKIPEPETLVATLDGHGQPAVSVLARATAAETKAALRAQTEDAMRLGIFGTPSFVVDEELFWGNDRLGDAIAWAGGQRGD